MSDQTICPICHTVFRITAIALADSKGMVQCGVCGMVFNAQLHSVTDDRTPLPTPSLVDEQPPELAVSDLDPIVTNEATTSEFAAHPSAGDDQSEQTTSMPHTVDERAEINKNVGVDSTLAPPFFQFTKKNVRKRASLEMGFLAVLLLLLAAQILIVYRDRLAVNVPHLLPALKLLCTITNCQIKLPADKSLIRISNTSFEVDPKNPDVISVDIMLENQANTILAYPNIALSLTNDDDRVIARKNFKPNDYLTQSQILNKGIAAHAEATIQLTLAVANVQATGYKLLVFY